MKKIYCLTLLFLLSINCSLQAQKELDDEVGETIGIWTINNGGLITNDKYNDKEGKKYWSYIMSVLPHDLINEYVVRFRLYTDGIQDDLGGFNSMSESNKEWTIEFDIADMDLNSENPDYVEDYQHTLIHEFGHLISLNASQMQPTEDEYQDDSKGYLTSEGYAIKGSYMDKYIKAFWGDDILFEWDKIAAIKNENKRVRKLQNFYYKYDNEFVSDYACESPEEDFAESWTFFVLCDISEPKNVKEDKVIFFHQFPELVEYRKKIRSKLKMIPNNYLERYMAKE
ncbi:hypothetical protein MY04_1228 [Flammeovirga sp. MY04]|uniref:putative zinc-binding metallopeptidase n=1 Tax=Flammeovirga sp. MY04 TaxID=1191459 RepID=UPI0008060CB7|nr:putative zinc-binding metallopeptidase [Flammeovirga sp. MY04]ANQ48605.1 hypothetical protein MY04_1228 [Flammeovirga sp. MY04]